MQYMQLTGHRLTSMVALATLGREVERRSNEDDVCHTIEVLTVRDVISGTDEDIGRY